MVVQGLARRADSDHTLPSHRLRRRGLRNCDRIRSSTKRCARPADGKVARGAERSSGDREVSFDELGSAGCLRLSSDGRCFADRASFSSAGRPRRSAVTPSAVETAREPFRLTARLRQRPRAPPDDLCAPSGDHVAAPLAARDPAGWVAGFDLCDAIDIGCIHMAISGLEVGLRCGRRSRSGVGRDLHES